MNFIAKKEIINHPGTPTPNCHASTVLPLDSGDVLSAWFGGTKEGCDDVVIWVSRRNNGIWASLQRICAEENVPHWNPVLFEKKDGTICLYFKLGKSIDVIWKTMVCYSKDHGVTWSAPADLVANDSSGGRGPVKNKSIYISNGDILAPASHEPNPNWFSFVDRSKDNGETWEAQGYVPSKAEDGKPIPMIQPTLWESKNGKIHMLVRTAAGKIYRSDSEDYGRTWCEAYDTGLLNPNSGIDLVKTDDGIIWLVSNPVGMNWGDRTPLTLTFSKDNGNTWETAIVLEETEVGREEEAEYSYPAITTKNGKLYITYTYNRVSIAYWEVQYIK